MAKVQIKLDEVKRRYEILIRLFSSPPSRSKVTDEEKELLDRLANSDIHGWLIGEVERLKALLKQHGHDDPEV